MAATSCPICCTLYDGKEDHPWDPCTSCWKAGWRVDGCGNKHQVPTCDKCGVEIVSGFMFISCPHKDQCALFPHDCEEATKAFARELIKTQGVLVVHQNDDD